MSKEEGETFTFSEKRGILTMRAIGDKHAALRAKLALLRLGYEITPLPGK